MNKQILVVIAVLSFCKMGLSVTDTDIERMLIPIKVKLGNLSESVQTSYTSTMSEVKKVQATSTNMQASLASIDSSSKQHTAQTQGLEQRLDRLILSNTKLIEFLVQKDHTIASTQDALTLVDKSKQLLEEELISKTERIAFLEDALKSLKEKMEDLTVENESIRAELEASIQELQLKLKQ
ncbi:MAG: hypothetical protein ACSW8C_02785 [bacterium]